MKKYKRKKEKNKESLFKFSNIIVLLVIGMNMWFTDRVLDAFEVIGVEPVVLIGAFFAFTTGELWLLAGIKKNKIKETAKSDRITARQTITDTVIGYAEDISEEVITTVENDVFE